MLYVRPYLLGVHHEPTGPAISRTGKSLLVISNERINICILDTNSRETKHTTTQLAFEDALRIQIEHVKRTTVDQHRSIIT